MQQDDSDNAYHRMKALKVTKSGKLRVRFTAKNQSGAYYWSWLISKNGGGTGNLADITEVSPTAMTTLTGNALGAFSDGMADGQANSVHNYRDFDVTVTNVEPGDQIELFGDGAQARDFTYVDDVALGTIAAGDYKGGFEIFNLGGGNKPITVNAMIENLESHLNKKAQVKNLPFSKADMLVTWANIDKADKLLNWKPLVSFEQGIENCVRL